MPFTPLTRHTRRRPVTCCSTRVFWPKPSDTLVLGASFAPFPGLSTLLFAIGPRPKPDEPNVMRGGAAPSLEPLARASSGSFCSVNRPSGHDPSCFCPPFDSVSGPHASVESSTNRGSDGAARVVRDCSRIRELTHAACRYESPGESTGPPHHLIGGALLQVSVPACRVRPSEDGSLTSPATPPLAARSDTFVTAS